MSGPVLGIDLGTTNSVVAVADGGQSRVLSNEEGRRLIPSVVSFHADGKILIGDEARDRRLIDARHTVYSVKRLIGRPFKSPEVRRAQQRFAFELVESPNGGVVCKVRGDTYTLTEISAFVLREVKRVAEEMLGQSCERAVITVPANFNELQRSATKAAGRVAGLEVMRIVNEPTAAALAYGISKDQAERVAVYDLGGGTFDFSILELEEDVFEVIGTAGDSFLGGDDLDLILADEMADAFMSQHYWNPREDEQAFERLRAAGEWAKCQLSEKDHAQLDVMELAYGEGGAPLDLSYRIERAEFERLVRPLIGRSFDVCRDALDQAGIEAKDIGAVILVGGSTRVPLVRQMVTHYFGQEPRSDIDPDLVVAQGAAIHGYALSGASEDELTKISVRRPTAADVQKAQRERSLRHEPLPIGPAFAPAGPRDVAAPPRAAPRPTPPPPAMVDLPDPVRAPTPAAAIMRPAIAVGTPAKAPPAPQGAGALINPLASTAIKPPRRDATLPFATQGRRDVVAPPSQPPLTLSDLPPVGDMHREESSIAVDSSYRDLANVLAPGQLETRDSSIDIDLDMDMTSLPPSALPPAQSPPAQPPPMPGAGLVDLGILDSIPDSHPPEPIAPPRAPEPVAMTAAPQSVPGSVQSVISMGGAAPPLLMDVTPHSLGIETAGGFCQHLIRRNAPIPAEQTRFFTTAQDGQTTVRVAVAQGEDRAFVENQALGVVELTDLPEAPRGSVKIEVTFMLDASGTLDVRAVDAATGREQAIRINLLGGADDVEIQRMRARLDDVLNPG